jgi:hypothetical protein
VIFHRIRWPYGKRQATGNRKDGENGVEKNARPPLKKMHVQLDGEFLLGIWCIPAYGMV